MNEGSKNKWLLWAVILLIVANLATLGVFWLNKPGSKKGPPPSEFLIREVGFDEKQKQQYETMVHEHRKAADEIRKRIGSARDSFFHLLKQTNVNDSTKMF